MAKKKTKTVVEAVEETVTPVVETTVEETPVEKTVVNTSEVYNNLASVKAAAVALRAKFLIK